MVRYLFRVLASVLLLAKSSFAQVPGTRISLDPPPGFSPAETFPGYQKSDVGASIMVNELPAPITEIRAGLTAEGLASRGMVLLASEPASVSGYRAQLLHVTQTAFGITFEKWMLVFGTAEQSVMLLGTFPQQTGESLRAPIRRSLLSAQWDLESAAGRAADLPFHVEETSMLKIASRLMNTLMLTKGGVEGPVSAEDPLLVVGASISDVDLSDLDAFSRQRLSQTAQVKQLENIQGGVTTVGGLPAYELTADAQDARTGVPIRIYQLIAADGARYFLVQGLVGQVTAPTFMPQFRDVARSLRRSR